MQRNMYTSSLVFGRGVLVTAYMKICQMSGPSLMDSSEIPDGELSTFAEVLEHRWREWIPTTTKGINPTLSF
jgi:hypothetical protein